ncbi:MAG TPA: hypothetical protein VNW68_08805, partial [Candidatus Limnocylindria bacterium]|nr:hypothetical protein [Candidatus Limnocylindria bacterium]
MRGGAPPRADRRRRAGRRWRLGRLTAKLPGAAAVLRRALLIWGLGHLALGDRRGILLVILQPLAVAAFVVAAVQLLPGTRWIVLFPALVALIFVHVGQALHAYRLAVRRGATPGGELQAVWLLPAVAMLTSVFWMIGGDEGSPEATLQRYVSAWQHERPAVAAELFSQPLQVSTIEAAWQGQHER